MNKIITVGEILLRLTPTDNQRLNQASNFQVYYGGAEANVAISLSQFGHSVSYLTSLPLNDLGDAAMAHLNSKGVDTSLIYRNDERMGSYFYEEGFSLRQAKVIYDRNHSSFLELSQEIINWDTVFFDVQTLHLTGITPALSKEMKHFTLLVLEEAVKRNLQISFDFNYRSKLWSIEEARKTYLKILPFVDICFVGYQDFVYILGEDDKKPFSTTTLAKYYKELADRYDITHLACTNRKVHSTKHNDLEGYFFSKDTMYKSESFSFEVLDRIGGGDAFAAGVLHGILSSYPPNEIVNFGIGASVLKHTVKGDYNSCNEKEVKEFLSKSAGDVNR